MSPVKVLGIGNSGRCDDGVGIVVARRLALQCIDSLQIKEHSGDGLGLMEAWRGASAVVLVDAVRRNGAAGRIHRLDIAAEPIAADILRGSSHGFGLVEAVELARVLGELPPEFVVYGIEGVHFGMGDALSPAVATAAEEVVRQILELVRMRRLPRHL